MPTLILLLIGWGTLAFGAVYDWAYWGLLAASVPVAVYGLTRRTSRARARVPFAVLAGLLLVAGAIGVQLIPLDRATLLQVSPGTDTFLRQYDVGYAIRVVLETRRAEGGGGIPGTPGPEGPGLRTEGDPGAKAPGLRTDALPTEIVHPTSINPAKTRVGLAFLGAFGLLLLGLTRGLSGRDLRTLAYGLTILGVLMALIAIIQQPLWNGKVYGLWQPEELRAKAFGPFINRNHFAGWMLMALPVVVGLFASQVAKGMRGVRDDWRSRVVWFSTPDASRAVLTGASILVMGLALVMTLSRSGISCLVLAIALSSLNVMRRQNTTTKQRLLAGYLLAVFLAAVTWTGVDAIGERFSRVDWGLGGRAGAWADAWRIHEHFPVFGSGFNTFGTATTLMQEYEADKAYLSEAHNDYLQIFVEGGYLVAIPVLILIAIVTLQIRARFLESHDDRTGYWLRLGAVTGIVAMVFQEIVEFSLQMPGNAILFTVLCAVAMRKATPKQRRGDGVPSGTPGRGNRVPSATPDLKVRGYVRRTPGLKPRGYVRQVRGCVLLALAVGMSACGGETPDAKSAQAVYSKKTGKLELITYDSNNDGRPDVWSYMDGTRLLRIELDADFDGIIERWEYYTEAGALEKVGFSRQKDGVVDAWAFQATDGTIGEVQVSTRRDGKVTRWEYYEKGALDRAEDDSDGDGRPDRWETYQDGALVTLALDTTKQGRPDRRLTYGPAGVTVERLK